MFAIRLPLMTIAEGCRMDTTGGAPFNRITNGGFSGPDPWQQSDVGWIYGLNDAQATVIGDLLYQYFTYPIGAGTPFTLGFKASNNVVGGTVNVVLVRDGVGSETIYSAIPANGATISVNGTTTDYRDRIQISVAGFVPVTIDDVSLIA